MLSMKKSKIKNQQIFVGRQNSKGNKVDTYFMELVLLQITPLNIGSQSQTYICLPETEGARASRCHKNKYGALTPYFGRDSAYGKIILPLGAAHSVFARQFANTQDWLKSTTG